ncbi:class I SAM-dependent methyltransferase family protein, partial [Pseudomonas aeruginosa]
LVAAAGFRKITQRVDQWGIFSVSLAQKVAR